MATFWLQDFNASPVKLTLASASPRRLELMKTAGFQFDIQIRPTEEHFPHDLLPTEVASLIALAKMNEFVNESLTDQIYITADTTVVLGNSVLNKPENKAHALDMLQSLSGKSHTVVTAYCLLSEYGLIQGVDKAQVQFADLDMAELEYYFDTCLPMDKAGSYGIQDWMGVAGVANINGSYSTVMGLPSHLIYQELKKWWHHHNKHSKIGKF